MIIKKSLHKQRAKVPLRKSRWCILYISAGEPVRVIADGVSLRGLLHSLAIRCVIQGEGQRKVTQEWVLLPGPVHLHLSHSYTNTHAQRHYTVQSPDESLLVCLISQRGRREKEKENKVTERIVGSVGNRCGLLKERPASWLVPNQCHNQHTHSVPLSVKVQAAGSLEQRCLGQTWAMELLPLCFYLNTTPYAQSTTSLWEFYSILIDV